MIGSNNQRIISLVPSITELLHFLGLENEVVGITKFCVHPTAWFHSKERIGGTKNINIEKIKNLHPNLIISNKEENVKEQIITLSAVFNMLVTDVQNYNDALIAISIIGNAINRKDQASALISEIKKQFNQLLISPMTSAAYLIWKKPWMTIGSDTFIHSMMEKAGFHNVFYQKQRYPQITLATIRNLQPKYVLLSSEPYPFKEKHIAELQRELPQSKIMLVDGEMFSWYGSRMLLAPGYFSTLLHTYA